MYFNIKKRIFIHKCFIFLPLLLFFSEQKCFYLVMLLFAFLHELAHYAAALLLGEKPDRLFVSPYGFELRFHSAMLHSELCILLAGPVFSLLAAAAGYFLGQYLVFTVNLVLFAVNIVPAFPLDGGKLLKLFLWHKTGVYYGNRRTKIIGYIIAGIFAVFSFYLPSPWLAAICTLIITRQAKLSGTPFFKKRKKIVPVKVFFADNSLPLMELARLFSPYYYTGVFIREQNNVVYENGIIEALRRTGYKGFVSDIQKLF